MRKYTRLDGSAGTVFIDIECIDGLILAPNGVDVLIHMDSGLQVTAKYLTLAAHPWFEERFSKLSIARGMPRAG